MNRQPPHIESKHIRPGTMEIDAVGAHGVTRALQERDRRSS